MSLQIPVVPFFRSMNLSSWVAVTFVLIRVLFTFPSLGGVTVPVPDSPSPIPKFRETEVETINSVVTLGNVVSAVVEVNGTVVARLAGTTVVLEVSGMVVVGVGATVVALEVMNVVTTVDGRVVTGLEVTVVAL